MKIKIASCLLALGFITGCGSTQTAQNETLEQRMARYASADNSTEPAPPAEGPGPGDLGTGLMDINRNPALMPTPLLRDSAASDP